MSDGHAGNFKMMHAVTAQLPRAAAVQMCIRCGQCCAVPATVHPAQTIAQQQDSHRCRAPWQATAWRVLQGDNNYGNDRMLYNKGQKWLTKDHIMGRAVGFLPYVGMVTIIMNDYPWLKYSVIGGLGILCLLGLDE
jgi:hypothetical protein